MIPKAFHSDVSYRQHLEELDSLFKKFGIASSSQFITAEANGKANRTGTDYERQTIIGRVIIYMQEHLSEPLSLEELAGEVHLSKFQLIRGFREELGTTPWKYLIGQRINKAKELLENGTAPAQAAVESGFYDQSHLNKTFREETGQTPKTYQEQNFKNRN